MGKYKIFIISLWNMNTRKEKVMIKTKINSFENLFSILFHYFYFLLYPPSIVSERWLKSECFILTVSHFVIKLWHDFLFSNDLWITKSWSQGKVCNILFKWHILFKPCLTLYKVSFSMLGNRSYSEIDHDENLNELFYKFSNYIISSLLLFLMSSFHFCRKKA